MASARANGAAPVLLTTTVCVSGETVVAAAGVAKTTELDETLRFGLLDDPVRDGCGSVSPSTVAVMPSTYSVMASLAVEVGALYPSTMRHTDRGRSSSGHSSSA